VEKLHSLVTRARGGDLEAYGQIVRRFQDMAYGFAYSFLGDFHLAQDAAQEAFIEAYRDLAKLREPAAFPGWFRRVVFKHCDRLTRRKRVATVPLEAAAAVASGESGPAEAAEKREMKDRVLAAIRALPEHQRMVTTLFYIDGYSQKDIAEFLDVPVTTVKKRLAHSRARLKERMMTMADETLKSFPLPERFADVVVQMNFVTERANPLAEAMRALSDEQMLAKSAELRRRLAGGQGRDSIKAEAFALVREATRRAWNQRHYDVQLVAAMILDQGWIAEEATGEGKTITCYPAAYMAVLEGMHVHVVTVNSYLATRDAELARAVFSRLGVTVGHLSAGDEAHARRRAYQCDITYGTNCEFGFDLLRDRLRPPEHAPVQGPLDFAIIDEADSLLIDEARTPLIIPRRADGDPDRYREADAVARDLIRRSASEAKLYEVDPDHKYSINLTKEGLAAAEAIAGVGSFGEEANADWPKRIEQALRAHLLYKKDREYVVQDGRVVIVDESTGRQMRTRQWSEGLHQAVECKEGVEITSETEVLAAITFKDYFSRYKKLAGMTGTARPQAYHFRERYGLDVAVVPTRRPSNRVDRPDRVYADADAKHAAIVEEVRHYSQDLGRPVPAGTRTIEQSERLSNLLSRHGIKHQILNARPENAAREAEIIAAAGWQWPLKEGSRQMAGAVTIATNMAGRGTDITLGPGVVCPKCQVPSAQTLATLGVEAEDLFPPESTKCCIHCPEYDETGRCAHCFKRKIDTEFPRRGRTACRAEPPCGLHVVGAERHDSRRIDDQLRARAGAQGQPGSSRFFLSLDDELMTTAPETLRERCRLALQGAAVIEDPAISAAIEGVQKQAERRTFEISLRCDACH